MKIKNIVFDLGGVLIDFKPENYLKNIGLSEEEISFFVKIIFYGDEWLDNSMSKCDVPQMLDALCKRYPEHKEKIKYIIENIDYNLILFEMTDTAEYLKKLKKRGYFIYLLSDLNRESYEYNIKYDFFEFIDGGVYSFEIGTLKPESNNYQVLLEKFHLKPEETIFIDDRKINIDTANKLGIHGIQFTSLTEVKKKVEKLL